MRAAVIGVGHLGQHHARIYAEMDGVELVGVVDTDEKAAREVAGRFGAPHFTSLDDLPEIDAASVATPTVSHHQVARTLLLRDVSLLIEKPLTRDLSEAEDLVKLAAERGRTLQVGHVERFNPACRAIERLGIRPRFIESQRISPFSFRSSDIGVVLDLMIHDLDLILHLMSSDVERVDAIGVSVLGMSEDIANVRLTFENGCVANVTASRVSLKSERKIRIFAPECYASADLGNHTGSVYRLNRDISEISGAISKLDPKTVSDPRALLFGDYIRAEPLETDKAEPLLKEIEAFVHAVRTGERPVVSGEDALRTLTVAHRILEEIGRFQERSIAFIDGADSPGA